MLTPGDTVSDYRKLKDGDLLFNGTKTHDGVDNVVRVISAQGSYPSTGFLGLYVDPENPAEKRIASDRPFFVWDFELERGKFRRAVEAQ